MRPVSIGICVVLVALAGVAAAANLGDLEWLAGSWILTKGDRTIEEQWMRPAGGMMIGMSRTLNSGKANGFEFLRIEQRGDDLFYIAQPQGRPATEFKLVKSSANEVVFENLQHDFPQQITYKHNDDGSLTASISGPGKQGPKTFRYEYQRAK
jgi:hypothetical protein